MPDFKVTALDTNALPWEERPEREDRTLALP